MTDMVACAATIVDADGRRLAVHTTAWEATEVARLVNALWRDLGEVAAGVRRLQTAGTVARRPVHRQRERQDST